MTTKYGKLLFRTNVYDYDPHFNYRTQDLIDLYILKIENQNVFKFKTEDQINVLITNQTKQRYVIIQQLYFRDILSRLIDVENDLTFNSYEWLSLIKYDR
ncbi:unnamed protein product [Rotaria sp. Silwood2]|nr:unnamed protein product [Rotaria sp. Silwood2]CAF4448742.1 unnamed protein product [Rotaria sp. Silwood2]